MNMLTAAAKGQRLDYIFDAANDTLEIPALRRPLRRRSDVALDGFVAGACRYLETNAKQIATVGTPYVAYDSRIASLEFTATIRIAGERNGAIYLTASRAMLTIMLMRMGSTDITVENMSKVLRDLANSMAHSARVDNSNLLIGDAAVQTRSGAINCGQEGGKSPRPLIVPIHWRKFTAQLVFCIE